MKQRLALLLAAAVLLAAFTLTACGGGGSEPASVPPAGTDPGTSAAEIPAAPMPPADGGPVDGSTYSTGLFSVLCPAGWSAFPAEDLFNAYGGQADPTGLHLCKGAESEKDLKRKPGMKINFYGEDDSFSAPYSGFYTDLTVYEASPIGRYVWNGFSGKNLGKRIIVLWTDDGKTRFQVSIWAEMDEGDVLTLGDPDVRAIIESISAD